MSTAQAVHVKARAVLRELGYSDGDVHREYKDWHIEIRSGLSYVSVWCSQGMVYLCLDRTPVYYRPGPWEQYLDRLFQRLGANGRASAPPESRRLPVRSPHSPEPSEDS